MSTTENIISEKQMIDTRKMNDALAAYFSGIEVDDHEQCYYAVGELIGLTCPYEPDTKSGDAQVVPKKYRQHFLLTGDRYLDMTCDKPDWRNMESYWQTVADRIRAYED